MKKIVIGTLAAAILVAVSGPVITGNMAEKELLLLVKRVNADGQAVLTIDEYNRGFLGAQATLTLELNAGVPEIDAKPVKLPVDIEHGPIFLSDFSFGISSLQISLSTESLGLEDFIQATNVVSYKAKLGFANTIQHSVHISPVSINDQLQFNFAGVDGQLTSNMAVTEFRGELAIGEMGFSYIDPVSGLISTAQAGPSSALLDWQVDGEREGLMSGFSEWQLPQLAVNSGLLKVELIDLQLKTENDIVNGAINLEQTISVKSVAGPVQLDNLLLEFSLSNIKLETYDAFLILSEALQDMQQEGEELEEEAFKALLRPVFQAGIRHEQHLSLDIAGGKLVADLDAQYVGDDASVDALFMQDDEKFLSSIEANLSASADSKAVMKTPLAFMVPGWAQQGLLRLNGDKFEFKASIKDAILNLNGQTIPLIAFLEPKVEDPAPMP